MQFLRRFCTTLKPVHSEIKNILTTSKVVLFMKGTPESPLCRFSQIVVQILDIHGVRNYAAIDVLKNNEIREGIKEYSHWPTIPQLFLQGELIGGCDILLEMHKNGDLVKELDKIGIKSELNK